MSTTTPVVATMVGPAWKLELCEPYRLTYQGLTIPLDDWAPGSYGPVPHLQSYVSGLRTLNDQLQQERDD